MSEPTSSVPDETTDAEVKESSTQESEVEEPADGASEVEEPATEDGPSTVELDIDQDKVDAWDAIKGDYQVDPAAESGPDTEEEDDAGEDGAGEDGAGEDGAEPGPDDPPEAEADATKS